MPRRDSPIRRSSLEQRNNYSPPRSRDFDRRNESLDRKYSPDRRKRSLGYRRNSRDRRRSADRSPKRKSPEYKGSSPNYIRNSLSYKRGRRHKLPPKTIFAQQAAIKELIPTAQQRERCRLTQLAEYV
ncbi:hypothetical protein FQA39_LY01996 [Lamprigera yunnana]|nr:hypothetical protein FQA39_LY01996 [Lamprigera yunnana]